MDRLMSHTTMARRLVSSSNCLTYNRSLRPRIFQSTYRSSSPGWYIRCSANSTENPRRGERCSPVRKPSTTPSVITSIPPSLETSSGSRRSSRSGLVMKGATYWGFQHRATSIDRRRLSGCGDAATERLSSLLFLNALPSRILTRWPSVACHLLPVGGYARSVRRDQCSSCWVGCCSPASRSPAPLQLMVPLIVPLTRQPDGPP